MDSKINFIKKYSLHKRIQMLYKIIHWKQLDNGMKRCNIKKGANLYAFEFMKKNLGRYVRVKDVQEYCSKRKRDETGHPLGDPGRSFEILRNDKLPLEWSEIQYIKNKYVKYTPQIKSNLDKKIIDHHKHKGDSFNKNIIEEKLKLCNYKCSITGISQNNGDLAADHFIPKEKGGLSVVENCVIINKILNEKKK